MGLRPIGAGAHRTQYPSDTFVYYDGLMKAPATPKVSRGKGSILLQLTSDHDWHDVMVIDRRPDGLWVASGWADKFAAGAGRVAPQPMW